MKIKSIFSVTVVVVAAIMAFNTKAIAQVKYFPG